MKTLQFISEDPKQKEFVDAIRRNVSNYFKEKGISSKGNGIMYFKAFTMLGIYLAPFVLILTVSMPIWMIILLLIIMGIGEAGIGMSVMHDAAHGAFSSKKWVNGFFASTMFILGSNIFNWKVQHNMLHHTYTNIYGYDEDIESRAIVRLSEHAPVRKIHRYQFIYTFPLYGLMTLLKLVTEINQLIRFNKEGITKELNLNPKLEVFKLVLIKVIYLAIILGLPLFLTDYRWWQILIGFCILHFTAGAIMSTIFQMAHVVEGADQPLPDETGVIPNEWMVHELNTTSDFARNNLFLNWYVGGLNFQIEHHLFPTTCHIHYARLAPIIESTAKEYGIKYNLKPSFMAALGSHVRKLKELGRLKK